MFVLVFSQLLNIANFSGVNLAHVQKAQPQYCSNVAMKVNAKLGGTTCKVASAKNWFTQPTMIIGKSLDIEF
jgi:hypothetical protein